MQYNIYWALQTCICLYTPDNVGSVGCVISIVVDVAHKATVKPGCTIIIEIKLSTSLCHLYVSDYSDN